LLPENAVIRGGRVLFNGTDVLTMNKAQLRDLRGRRVSMVFQDPMTTLNPVLSIGAQMIDIQYRDRSVDGAQKRQKAVAMAATRRHSRRGATTRPLRARVQWRHAPADCDCHGPARQSELLIADEPTTALDVTLEAQIIHLLRQLRREFKGSILFISHNLGLIAELCDYVVILYAGEVVEQGTVHDIFHRPRHPYTEALLVCDPARLDDVHREAADHRGRRAQPAANSDRLRLRAALSEGIRPLPSGNSPSIMRVGATQSARCHLITP